jgi:Activator of Hsp90 ATPase homolog 1-like protein
VSESRTEGGRHDHVDRADDAGLPGVHQGQPGGDLGGDHQAGVHRALLLRRPNREQARQAPLARPGRQRLGRRAGVRVRPAQAARAGWRSLYDPELAAEDESRVTWQIEPQEGGYCLVTVTHDRLEGAPKTAESVSGTGWMMVLSGLKTLLETGKPIAG